MHVFVCFAAVIWAHGTFGFGDFKGGEIIPGRTPRLCEHECGLVEVKGNAVWILHVLVDATRHRWRNRNGGPKQRFGGPSLKEREGKGSEWRSANRCCQLQTRTTNPRRHANAPPPL